MKGLRFNIYPLFTALKHLSIYPGTLVNLDAILYMTRAHLLAPLQKLELTDLEFMTPTMTVYITNNNHTYEMRPLYIKMVFYV